MPSVNEITGNNLVSKASNQEAYAEGWDRIFGEKDKELEDKEEEEVNLLDYFLTKQNNL